MFVESRSDEATERLRKEIALVDEYRTRLIADVATGKLDVREAAAKLPDDVDDGDEPFEESGDDLNDETFEEAEK